MSDTISDRPNVMVTTRDAAAASLAAVLNTILDQFDSALVLADGLTDVGSESWHPAYDYDNRADDLHEHLHAARRQIGAALLLHRYVAEPLEPQSGAEEVAL